MVAESKAVGWMGSHLKGVWVQARGKGGENEGRSHRKAGIQLRLLPPRFGILNIHLGV